MNCNRISSRSLIVIGVVAFIICVLGFFGTIFRVPLIGSGMWVAGITLSAIWTRDAIHCRLAEKAAWRANLLTAEKHLRKVRMLQEKSKAIRWEYELGGEVGCTKGKSLWLS